MCRKDDMSYIPAKLYFEMVSPLPFTGHAIGRQAILDNKVIDHLFRMYEDPDELVRRNMYTTLKSVAEFPIGEETLKWQFL